ncbi:MAG: hypothetical protein LBO78_02485 [Rickettsiales bacterium]|jgi:DNA polymerase-3 subunit gamma/tau|nr:hypothetical protein [Rickettsiales bacterium]
MSDEEPLSISILTIESVVAILKEKKNFLLSQDVEGYCRFVAFANGVLELNLAEGAPRELIRNLNKFFLDAKYAIEARQSDQPGEPSIRERQLQAFEEQKAAMAGNPVLREVLARFPDSYVAKIEQMD